MCTTCLHRSYVLRWGREGGGPEVNKFEQVSSDGQQMSLAVGSMYSEVPCVEGGSGLGPGSPCTVRFHIEGGRKGGRAGGGGPVQ